MKKNTISILLSLVLTFILLRELIRFATSDFAASLIPAWSSSSYNTEWTLSISTLVIGVFSGIAFLLFKGFIKLFSSFIRK